MQIAYEEIKILYGLLYKQQIELVELSGENLRLKSEVRKLSEVDNALDDQSRDGRN